MEKIVITGASSGIGMAIARRLSATGRPMLLQANSKKIPEEEVPAGAEIIRADFSKEREFSQFLSCLSDVSILVNVAASVDTQLIPMISEASVDRMIRVNIAAFTRICQRVIPPMCARREGIIVNVSSVVASKTYRGQSVYAGTKAYMEAFSRAIAAEYASRGIRCNCVAPGSIASGSLSFLMKNLGDKIKDVNASGKLGSPEDVAGAVAFLCSPDAAFVNGEVLHIDGGHWLGL